MKKIIKTVLMLISLSFLVGCFGKNETQGAPVLRNANTEEYKIKAVVNKISDSEIEVMVADDGEAFGVYRVHTTESTVYKTESEELISRDVIEAGDVIVIIYNGQVMRSYPPQIVALSIVLVDKK